jgi:hypothetical protein
MLTIGNIADPCPKIDKNHACVSKLIFNYARIILPTALGPEVYSGAKRNEYQKRVRLTLPSLHPSN